MNLKAFLKTPKGKLAAALLLLACSWIFLFFHFMGPVGSLIPTAEEINEKSNELKRLKKENASLKLREKEQKDLEKRYEKLLSECWQPKDGLIEMDLRSRVQTAAQQAQFNLNSLGSVKMVKINNDLSFAEIDLQGVASIEIIANFLTTIQKIRPALSWKRFDLRMNMRFRRPNEQQTNTVQELNLNGTLRVIYAGGREDEK